MAVAALTFSRLSPLRTSRRPAGNSAGRADAIAIYAVAGALASVDQRLSRRADRDWRHHWKAHPAIWRVHSHSTGCRWYSVYQVVEVAQFRRYRPAQLVVAERQPFEVVEVAQFRRYRPAQLVVAERQPFEVVEVAQFRRYRPAQLVAVRATALTRLSRLPSSGGIDPLNWLLLSHSEYRLSRLPSSGGIDPLNWLPSRVPSGIQVIATVGEVAQFRRYRPAQLVVAEPQRLPGWRGCPVPTVSTRSIGCCGATANSRLARLPSSDGIDPLNWLLLSDSDLQVVEVAQFRRYRPAQLVVASRSVSRLSRLPSSDGIDPLNWLPPSDSS